MAETQTPNFKWTKPDIGGDATVWGNVLNQTIDAIDAVAWATLNAGVPIGTVTMFAGSAPPVNWMWCDGAVYLDADVPSLVAILNHAWPGSDSTHTAVPNLWSGRTPVGYDGSGWTMGASGGEVNHTLSYSEMPSHAHGVSDPTHAHGAYQNAHNHTIVTGGHAHNIVDRRPCLMGASSRDFRAACQAGRLRAARAAISFKAIPPPSAISAATPTLRAISAATPTRNSRGSGSMPLRRTSASQLRAAARPTTTCSRTPSLASSSISVGQHGSRQIRSTDSGLHSAAGGSAAADAP